MLAIDALHVAAMSAWVGGVAVLVAVLPARHPAAGAGRAHAGCWPAWWRGSRRSRWCRWLRCWPPASCSPSSTCGPSGTCSRAATGGRSRSSRRPVMLLIGAGAVNRRRTLPRLRGGRPGTAPARAGLGLRRVIRGELALMALAIARDRRAGGLRATGHLGRRAGVGEPRPRSRPAGDDGGARPRGRQRDPPLPVRPPHRRPVRPAQGGRRSPPASPAAHRPAGAAYAQDRPRPLHRPRRRPGARRATGGSRSTRGSATSTSTRPRSRCRSGEPRSGASC